jgi:hypothetical protein
MVIGLSIFIGIFGTVLISLIPGFTAGYGLSSIQCGAMSITAAPFIFPIIIGLIARVFKGSRKWASLEMLTYVSRNLAGARLLLVGTYRDVEVDRTHPLSAALAELRRASTFGRVVLRGLNADEVRRMLSSITGQEVPWGLAEAVHRQTEGNPLFVQEVIRYLSEDGAIVREKEIGTLEQIMVTPIRPWELMVGKTLPFALLGFLDVVLISLLGVFWFDVPLRGDPLVLLLSTSLFLMCSVGVGLFMSTVSSTQQQAQISTFFF